jgi:hypothetical protein
MHENALLTLDCRGGHCVAAHQEKQECEKLMLDALLLKAEMLAEAGQHGDAIATLSSAAVAQLTARLPQAGVSLATKVQFNLVHIAIIFKDA